MKRVYTLDEGSADQKDLLGGKGANLCEMHSMGVPVPRAVIVSTEACNEYRSIKTEGGKIQFLKDLVAEVLVSLNDIGASHSLYSVRSGARVSMPGMMDTILNVGVAESWQYWMEDLGERTALDCYRRFLQMYGEVALGVPASLFAKKLNEIKKYKYGMEQPPANDAEMSVKHLEKLVEAYKYIITKNAPGEYSPEFSSVLRRSIGAVFDSWDNERAKEYRKIHNIPDDWGTAVVIQEMVFGNMNDQSCSGVMFTRDPATGAANMIGEFLPNAQGEDVVAGIRTPMPLGEMQGWNSKVYDKLLEVAINLEKHYRDMQDIEFTVQDGELYILQTRNAKRSDKAAIKVAYDMYKEVLITKEELKERVPLRALFGKKEKKLKEDIEPDAVGLPAGGGVVTGYVVTSEDVANEYLEAGRDVILVAEETTPDDISVMNKAVGILTSTGGVTCHAAVVARGMNKTCVVGCSEVKFVSPYIVDIGDTTVTEGTKITIDGKTGRVWAKELELEDAAICEEAAEILRVLISGEYGLLRLHLNEFLVAPIGRKEIYLDTYGMNKDELAEGLKKLEAVLMDVTPQVDRVYLDLSLEKEFVEESGGEARALHNLVFGLYGEGEKLEAVIEWGVADFLKKIVTVVAEGEAEEYLDELKEAGFCRVKKVGSVKEVFELGEGGAVSVSDYLIDQVGSKENAIKLLTALSIECVSNPKTILSVLA